MIYILESSGIITENHKGFASPIERIFKSLKIDYRTLSLVSNYTEIEEMLSSIIRNNDLVVISGGFIELESTEVWYLRSKEIIKKLISNCNPTVGICFGAQLIYEVMFPDSLILSKVREIGPISINSKTKNVLGKNEYFCVHSDGILYNETYDDSFESVITASVNGFEIIEFFKIKDQPILGTQFHPELDFDSFVELTEVNQLSIVTNQEKLNNETLKTADNKFFKNISKMEGKK